MKKQWIVTAFLVVLCAAVPVFASEELPDLRAQVVDILVRLEKVEAYEERIAALEIQVAELTAPVETEPASGSGEPVSMTEEEYFGWLEQEMVRFEERAAGLEELFESDDPMKTFAGLSEVLDMLFEFHDAHSLIDTPSPVYDDVQPVLSCVVENLEPLRGIEDKSVTEAFAALMPLFMVLMENPDDFLVECNLDAIEGIEELFPVEIE